MTATTLPAAGPTAPARPVLTLKDVADLLRCSVKSVERLGDAVPSKFRVGRLVRFDAVRVEDWIRRGCPAV